MNYLLDSNILIYLAFNAAPEHIAAKAVTDKIIKANEIIILTEAVVLSFFRISTLLKPTPLTPAEARLFIDALLNYPKIQIFAPTVQHYRNFGARLENDTITGNLTMDAHLAEVALLTNSTIVTNDDDFKKFPGVRFVKI
jgi:uncharacterized protein